MGYLILPSKGMKKNFELWTTRKDLDQRTKKKKEKSDFSLKLISS